MKQSAVDVEHELKSAVGASKFQKFGLGAATATLVVYGIATGGDAGATAIAGILATLGLTYPIDVANRKELTSQKAQPGYLLLKAEELLQKRHRHV